MFFFRVLLRATNHAVDQANARTPHRLGYSNTRALVGEGFNIKYQKQVYVLLKSCYKSCYFLLQTIGHTQHKLRKVDKRGISRCFK